MHKYFQFYYVLHLLVNLTIYDQDNLATIPWTYVKNISNVLKEICSEVSIQCNF